MGACFRLGSEVADRDVIDPLALVDGPAADVDPRREHDQGVAVVGIGVVAGGPGRCGRRAGGRRRARGGRCARRRGGGGGRGTRRVDELAVAGGARVVRGETAGEGVLALQPLEALAIVAHANLLLGDDRGGDGLGALGRLEDGRSRSRLLRGAQGERHRDDRDDQRQGGKEQPPVAHVPVQVLDGTRHLDLGLRGALGGLGFGGLGTGLALREIRELQLLHGAGGVEVGTDVAGAGTVAGGASAVAPAVRPCESGST